MLLNSHSMPWYHSNKEQGHSKLLSMILSQKPSDVSDGGLFVKYFLQMSFLT